MHSSWRRLLSRYYRHAMRDGSTLFTQSLWGSDSLWQQFEMQKVCACWVPRQLTEEYLKNHSGVALNFLTQYKADGNDLLEWIVTSDESWIHFYEPERKSACMVWKKRGRSAEKIQEWRSARQVMLTAFWDCHGLVYAEFGPDACKEKRNVTLTLISIL